MKIYLVGTFFFYLFPLFFLSQYQPLINFFGEPQTWLFHLIYTKDSLYPNVTGLLIDIAAINLALFLAYPKKTITKDRLITMTHILIRVFKNKGKAELDEPEKVTIRLYLLKLFFVPLMLQFTLNQFMNLGSGLSDALTVTSENLSSKVFYFTLVFAAYMYLIDVLCFLMGYTLESKKLKNVVVSVDPTVSGWLACLMCYPPFNEMTIKMIGGLIDINDFTPELASNLYLLIAPVVMVLLAIYVYASVNLLFKASNLTYRGLVRHGAYAWVRHPAYAAKVGGWILMTAPFIYYYPWFIVGIIGWGLIYTLRALTEERHLLQADPDVYKKYMEEVPYRFIPGVI